MSKVAKLYAKDRYLSDNEEPTIKKEVEMKEMKEMKEIKISGLDQIDHEELQEEIKDFRRKLSLIHGGMIVHIKDCNSTKGEEYAVNLKLTLSTVVGGFPLLGDINLKITKQTASKMKKCLGSIED